MHDACLLTQVFEAAFVVAVEILPAPAEASERLLLVLDVVDLDWTRIKCSLSVTRIKCSRSVCTQMDVVGVKTATILNSPFGGEN